LVQLEIDGQAIFVPPGTTILEAARKLNIEIPAPCHQEDAAPKDRCQVCAVDADARRNYVAACTFKTEINQFKRDPKGPDMVIRTDTEGVQAAHKTVLRLLMADHHAPCLRQRQSGDCELERLAVKFGCLGVLKDLRLLMFQSQRFLIGSFWICVHSQALVAKSSLAGLHIRLKNPNLTLG